MFKNEIWTTGPDLNCAFFLHIISSALKILIYKCNALTSLFRV